MTKEEEVEIDENDWSDEESEDEDIVALRWDLGWTSDEECDEDQLYALKKVVYDDDMPNFVTKVNMLFDLDVKPYTIKSTECPGILMKWICKFGALSCATALLQGQTCLSVDLNLRCDLGRYPLHLAASTFNYDLVKLFLSHGAQIDVRNRYPMTIGPLPIHIALKSLNKQECLVDWAPEESIYKLVFALCLPQMNEALATIKLLALETKDVNDVFITCAKEGLLVEMAALLMTANELISAPSVCQSEVSAFVKGGVSILDIISGKTVVQANEDIFAKVGVTVTPALEYTLKLLNIFARTGDAIRSYLCSRHSQMSTKEVVKDVASIFREAGFELNDKYTDWRTIDCESIEVKEARGSRDRTIPYMSSLCNSRIFDPSGEVFHLTKQGYLIKVFDPHWSVPSSSDRQRINISQLLRFHETPRKGENYAMQRYMSTYKPSNLVVSLASSIKRGMRRMIL